MNLKRLTIHSSIYTAPGNIPENDFLKFFKYKKMRPFHGNFVY
jgi:hypothetical protein